MLQWGDVVAGTRAGGALVLRWAFWWAVLKRALFSRVALGYLLAAFAIGFGVRTMLQGSPLTGNVVGLLMLVMLGAPIAIMAAACALIPYMYWVFHPVVARFAPDHLRLPEPEVAEEPPFGRYVWWSLLPAAWLLASIFAAMLRPVAMYVVLAVATASLLKLATRAALAAHYAPETMDRFLAATRWQRPLVWLPVLFVLGVALAWGVEQLVQLLGLRSGFGFNFGGMALALVLHTALSSFVAASTCCAILLAAARYATPGALGELSVTQPMSEQVREPAPRVARPMPTPRPALGAGTLALGAVVLLVAGVAGAWFGRFHLTDLYYGQDPVYRGATMTGWPATGPQPTAGVRQRLQSGLVTYACAGQHGRADWLWRLGVQDNVDLGPVLVCGACMRKPEAIAWVDAKAPQASVNTVVRSRGTAMSALACAARDNDLALAQRLKDRGADPLQPPGNQSPVHAALQRASPRMLALLLQDAPPATLVAAVEAAQARHPRELTWVVQAAGIKMPAAQVRDAHGRNLLHLAAIHNDNGLAAIVPDAAALRAQPDAQGALPWMHLLRRAERDGAPVNLQLLQYLLPPDADVNTRAKAAAAGMPAALPLGWSAAQAAIHSPEARIVLGPSLDYGVLPDEAARWWQFRDEAQALQFVRELTQPQLLRVEHPEAPNGVPGKPLSQALHEQGWPHLADLTRKLAARVGR